MSFAVLVPRKVERELDIIVDYIADQSQAGAASWLTAFEQALNFLRDKPDACALAPEDDYIEHYDIRHHLFKTRKGKPYRLVFRIEAPDIVRLLGIRGPGEDFVPVEQLE